MTGYTMRVCLRSTLGLGWAIKKERFMKVQKTQAFPYPYETQIKYEVGEPEGKELT